MTIAPTDSAKAMVEISIRNETKTPVQMAPDNKGRSFRPQSPFGRQILAWVEAEADKN